jgi:hypothetical protein
MCVGARLLWGRTEERLFLEIGCHELAPRLNAAGQPTVPPPGRLPRRSWYGRSAVAASVPSCRRWYRPCHCASLLHPSACCLHLLPIYAHVRSLVASLLESVGHVPSFIHLCHLLLHCRFVRPGTSSEIAAQSVPLCFSTASLSVMSSSVVHIPVRAIVSFFFLLESKIQFHRCQHCCCFARPGTSSEIAAQSSPLYFSTASFSALSSSAVHLPARAIVSFFFDSKIPFHLCQQHCCFVRPETSAAISAHSSPFCFSTASISMLSSSTVHLPACGAVSSLLESKEQCHLLLHCFFRSARN